MSKLLITLDNLKTFLADLKVYIKDYFDSRIDTEMSSTSSNPVANKTITNKMAKIVWKGTAAQIPGAIESGEIEPGFTQVIVTDDPELIYEFCTMQDIYNLFGLVYVA